MHRIRIPISLLLLITLTGCGFLAVGERPANSHYCDKFLIYDMCAQDLDRDGIVEYVYFPDSREVFMYRSEEELELAEDLGMHRCAMMMDDELVATTSRVFFVDDETTYLQKQDIRGAMLIRYISHLPRMTACNMEAEQLADGDGGGS